MTTVRKTFLAIILAIISIRIISFIVICIGALFLFASCRESPQDVREGTHRIEQVLKSSGIDPVRVYSSGRWLTENGGVNVELTLKKKDIDKYLILKDNPSLKEDKLTFELDGLRKISDAELFDALDSKRLMSRYSSTLRDLVQQQVLSAVLAKNKTWQDDIDNPNTYTINSDATDLRSSYQLNNIKDFRHFVNLYNEIDSQYHYVKDKDGYEELVPTATFDKELLWQEYDHGYLQMILYLYSSDLPYKVDSDLFKNAHKYKTGDSYDDDEYYVNNEVLGKYVNLNALPKGIEVIVSGDDSYLVNEEYVKNEGLKLVE